MTYPLPDIATSNRATVEFERQRRQNASRTDRMFAVLMLLQWGAAVLTALLLSPKTWVGATSSIHPHVWMAVWFGGILSSLPVYMAWRHPGDMVTRHVIAIAQVLFSSLLVHLSGGRIETHFHVFGSLAFLAFYRDWRVLVPATLFVAADHFVRGVFWPETIFGITTASHWRWLEHAGWVVFEDIFLVMSCRHGVRDTWNTAIRTAELERSNIRLEQEATERKLAEAIAQRSALQARRLALVAAHTDNAVVITDCHGCIEWVNEGFTRITEYALAEVVGKRPGSILQGELTDPQTVQHMREQVARQQPFQVEIINYSKSGRSYWLAIEARPLFEDGQLTGFMAIESDITERKHSEEAICRANALLRAQQDAAIDGILVINEERHISTFNSRLMEIWNAPDELLQQRDGTALLDFMSQMLPNPEAFRQNAESLNDNLERVYRNELPLLDGRVLDCYSGPVRSETGEDLGRVWYFRDITDLKQVEKQLRESQERFDFTLQSVGVAAWNWEMPSNTLNWSDNLESIHGLPVGTLDETFEAFKERLNPDDQQVIRQRVIQAVEDGEPYEVEYRMNGTDGSISWFETKGRVIYDDQGVPLRMTGICADITERKRVEAELRQSEERQRLILDTAMDGVVTMDAEGRITGWNRQAEEIFGWKRSEALGRDLDETIIPAEYRQAHNQGLAHYRKTGEGAALSQRLELAALHRSGRVFPCELAIIPLRIGKKVSFSGFIRDISDRRRNEEELRQSRDAAEAANRAKSAFLANMSHEIRTPLNGILGFADVLMGDPNGDPAERRDHLQTIRDSGRHLLGLINDILDLSKIESGQMDMEKVRCSPHDIIAEVISILRVRAHERGLTLDYVWNGPIPESIESDPVRLRQILMNLIGNAIKFTESGGVQVVVQLTGDTQTQLKLDVIDTGIGIASEALDQVFQPFVQADGSITRRFGGTGLGLSISRQLARLLGGELSVQSEIGRGSVFSVVIATGPRTAIRMMHGPAADVLPTNPQHVGDAEQTLPPCRILLVEDGATNRKLLSLILHRAGAIVQTAENGRLGVDMALAETFDLIMMDMQMPVLDGYSAARELRDCGVTIPIIALTAHAMKGDEDKCRAAGCSGYLTKPIDRKRLLQTTAEALAASSPEFGLVADATEDTSPLISTLPTDDPDFREIVEEFVGQLDEKLAALVAAWEARDLRQVAELAHWMKGSAGTVGFDALTAPASDLEHLARHERPEEIPAALERLQRFARRVQVAATV